MSCPHWRGGLIGCCPLLPSSFCCHIIVVGDASRVLPMRCVSFLRASCIGAVCPVVARPTGLLSLFSPRLIAGDCVARDLFVRLIVRGCPRAGLHTLLRPLSSSPSRRECLCLVSAFSARIFGGGLAPGLRPHSRFSLWSVYILTFTLEGLILAPSCDASSFCWLLPLWPRCVLI